MKGIVVNIQDRTDSNRDFRRVIFTGPNMQLVLMSLDPGEEIGEEVHESTDQFFRIEDGQAEAWIDGQMTHVENDDAFVVPAGAAHNVKNSGDKALKLYTIYAPPNHADGTVHHTKADAEKEEKAPAV